MSNAKPATDTLSKMGRIEELIRQIEALPDQAARSSTIELMSALMEFHGAGLDRLLDIVADSNESGVRLIEKCAEDEVVSSLLLLYGLHPDTLETRVIKALEKVRPYLDSHGGNVSLVGIDDGVVRLRLEGSCQSCASSTVTMKLAIESAVFSAAPDVVAVEALGTEPPSSSQTGFVQIRSSRPVEQSRGDWCDVDDLHSVVDGTVQQRNIAGRSILFCRLGENFYAYGDDCPNCGHTMSDALLNVTSLVCRKCQQRYDVIRAGRGLDQPQLHLEPVPLLSEKGRTRIAIPTPVLVQATAP